MAKEKLDKKILENNNFEAIMIGLMMILISAIGLIGKGPVGEFLQYNMLFLFGMYYILVYLFIVFLGIYLIVKKHFLNIKFNMYLVAGILFFLILLSASNISNEQITLTNFASLYLENLSSAGISLFSVEGINEVLHSGGGFFGYLLQGALTTCFSYIGYIVALSIFGVVALLICLKEPIFHLFKFFKNMKKRESEEKVEEPKRTLEANELLETSENEENDEEEVEQVDENKYSLETYAAQSLEKIQEPTEDLDITKSKTVDIKMDHPTINVSYNTYTIDKVDSVDASRFNKEEKKSSFDFTDVNPIEEDDLVSIPSIKPSYEVKEERIVKEKPVVTKLEVETADIPVVTKEITNNNTPVIEKIVPQEEVKIFNETSTGIQKDVSSSIIGDLTNREKMEDKQYEDSSIHKKKSLKDYHYPPIDIFKDHPNENATHENIALAETRLVKLNETFTEFRVGARCESYTIGPSVTRFNVRMNEGVKVGTLESVKNEIGQKLGGVKNVRLELVVEGKDTSSIELGNAKAEAVSFKDCLNAIASKTKEKDKLLVPLGKGIDNEVESVNIDELPHLLVAGTTGSGKSVFINTIIAALLMRNRPDELKLMLIDPKQVEFTKYDGLPHLLCPVVTSDKQGIKAFKKLVEEMERRYTLFREKGKGVTKISEYNALAPKLGLDPLPNIVVIVDEFSDFMSEHGKEIEPNVKRLCQKSRACGIYLIICTQRPSVNVVTGDIKAVVPSRIGLKLPSFTDSRTILDEGGAEQLIGHGDMLCKLPGHSSMIRVQGSYIPTDEIIDLIDYIKSQAELDYDPNFTDLDTVEESSNFMEAALSDQGAAGDELLDQARAHVISTHIASTSNLQSRFGIGFPRADKLLMLLEDEGVLGRNPNGRRIVKVTKEEWNEAHPDKQI